MEHWPGRRQTKESLVDATLGCISQSFPQPFSTIPSISKMLSIWAMAGQKENAEIEFNLVLTGGIGKVIVEMWCSLKIYSS